LQTPQYPIHIYILCITFIILVEIVVFTFDSKNLFINKQRNFDEHCLSSELLLAGMKV